MGDNRVTDLVCFYDHEVGKRLYVYGNVEEVKLDQFETNEDYWITLTDSCRTLSIPKIDVTRITVLTEGDDLYRKGKGDVLSKKNSRYYYISRIAR